MRCSDCKHFKDRYTLYMDGGFPDLQQLLDKGAISSRDFMCEGYGCIFRPCEDFTFNKEGDMFMGIPFSDLRNDVEKRCQEFEPKVKAELVKNIYLNAIKDKEYVAIESKEENRNKKRSSTKSSK